MSRLQRPDLPGAFIIIGHTPPHAVHLAIVIGMTADPRFGPYRFRLRTHRVDDESVSWVAGDWTNDNMVWPKLNLGCGTHPEKGKILP